MFREINCNLVCKISRPSVTYLIYTSQHSDATQWTWTLRQWLCLMSLSVCWL